MSVFFGNIFLAVLWVALTGQFTLGNLILGFALGYVILSFARPFIKRSAYYAKVPLVVRFLVYFLWEVVLANLRVAYAVLRPARYMKPGVIAVPLTAETNVQITLLANCITLTPGTLSVDVSRDRRVLYVHALHIQDPETLRQEIKSGLEKKLLEVLP